MFTFHNYISFSGLAFILYSIAILLFPPAYGNLFYGFLTKGTQKNKEAWYAGQKLFAVSTIIIGLIFQF